MGFIFYCPECLARTKSKPEYTARRGDALGKDKEIVGEYRITPRYCRICDDDVYFRQFKPNKPDSQWQNETTVPASDYLRLPTENRAVVQPGWSTVSEYTKRISKELC